MITDIPIWAAIPLAILLVIAGFFAFTGSLGMLRLPHFYSRIHAPTLANTLASFCIVVAIIIMAAVIEHRFVAHALLISFFLIITSPVTAMLLMRAAIKRELRRSEEVGGTAAENAPEIKLQGSSMPVEFDSATGKGPIG